MKIADLRLQAIAADRMPINGVATDPRKYADLAILFDCDCVPFSEAACNCRMKDGTPNYRRELPYSDAVLCRVCSSQLYRFGSKCPERRRNLATGPAYYRECQCRVSPRPTWNLKTKKQNHQNSRRHLARAEHLDGCFALDPIEYHVSGCPHRYVMLTQSYLNAFYERLLGLTIESLSTLTIEERLNLIDL